MTLQLDDDAPHMPTNRDQEEYEIPQLPPTRPPDAVHGVPTAELYKVIDALRRQIDDASRESNVKEILKQQPKWTLAIAQVMLEAGLLRNSDGDSFPLPSGETPPLPPGASSWAVPKGQTAAAVHSFF